MSPFKEKHAEDIVMGVRDELYVVAALLLSVSFCADKEFDGHIEEATALTNAAHAKVRQLLADAEAALQAFVTKSGGGGGHAA